LSNFNSNGALKMLAGNGLRAYDVADRKPRTCPVLITKINKKK